SPQLQAVNAAVLAELEPYQTIVWLCRAEDLEVEAELEEMWSYWQTQYSED
ncbi:MAG: hypothetical protein HC866_25525, partial [Leptolyngbyaceae cyanobacterium RU_5_1]|nr:hypothetical protein [Leptolyngbyaceae cyanobacterium RU_5_1]